MNSSIAFAVHGGAWNIPDELWPAHREGCARAHAAGLAILRRGGSGVEAVCAALAIMEDDPTFDAGYGSFLTAGGTVELDAGLMEGEHLKSGAVLGVSRLKNPIYLAEKVMSASDHCIFIGEGAHQFAQQQGLPMVDPKTLIHPREKERLDRFQAGDRTVLEEAWVPTHDTVGALALDAAGNLAAGNSTGGIIAKAPGRVGDAALVGVGYYADNQLGAVVCTGWGEAIMRTGMAAQALHHMAHKGLQAAADQAIARMAQRVGGYGGMLLMSPQGKVAAAHNTARMAYHF